MLHSALAVPRSFVTVVTIRAARCGTNRGAGQLRSAPCLLAGQQAYHIGTLLLAIPPESLPPFSTLEHYACKGAQDLWVARGRAREELDLN